MNQTFRCGYVGIIGRPNVGKSTLLNHLLGQKISITSRKPQTTRHRILGIKTIATAQIVYVDTPGIQHQARRAINRYMNRTAESSLHGVDAIVFVSEALEWTATDELVLEQVHKTRVPLILALNKVDRIGDKTRLLPYLAEVSARAPGAGVVPISAQKGDNLDELEEMVVSHLPEAQPLFPKEQVTDKSMRFIAAELVREKLFRRLGEEVPYGISVDVENYAEQHDLVRIDVVIWVDRPGQKSIVIGRQGRILKEVGASARRELVEILGKKVFLQSWVKVKKNWPDNELALKDLGYTEEQ